MANSTPISFLSSLASDLKNVDMNLLDQNDLKLTSQKPEQEQYRILADLCSSKIYVHPQWALLAGRIRMKGIKEAAPKKFSESVALKGKYYMKEFSEFIKRHAIVLDSFVHDHRDYTFDIFAVESLAKSYLERMDGKIIETPQYVYLRVATYLWFPCDVATMNLRENMKVMLQRFKKSFLGTTFANQIDALFTNLPTPRTFTLEDELASLEKIKRCYDLMAAACISHASPTLFNAGKPVDTSSSEHAQLASCFVFDVPDNIEGIIESWSREAIISKSGGGIGENFASIRHSDIGSGGCSSGGVVPWIKISATHLSVVDQGGKRKGSGAKYIRDWHIDFFEFLDMKKATGPEEERAREGFYGLCVSDEFMRRVENDEEWTLFCPKQTNGLEETWGKEFEDKYRELESSLPERTPSGLIQRRTFKARTLWERIYLSFVEAGMPYIFFIDNANRRNNHENIGMIKLSNLCMEITLHTSENYVSSCNLAALVLDSCVEMDENRRPFYNRKKLEEYTRQVVRNMNQVIDRTYYPALIPQIRYSNMMNRPLGIGIVGLADVFAKMDYTWDSPQAKELNEDIMETIYYGALSESVQCAKEEGYYPNFPGSPGSKGLFQFEMAGYGVRKGSIYDWEKLRTKRLRYGDRNSHLLALMPTATSAQLLGKTECFEPPTHLIYTRRVLSGEFVITNKYLVDDLQELGLWNTKTLKTIWEGGSILDLIKDDQKPATKFRLRHLARKHATAFKLGQRLLSELDIARCKWVCQSASFNAFMENISYSKMNSLLFDRWRAGSKTGVYYVRQPAKATPTNFSLDSIKIPKRGSMEEEKEFCISCVM